MTNKKLTRIIAYSKKTMNHTTTPNHDFTHVDMVAKNALLIAKILGVDHQIDLNLLQACCYLHDIGWINKNNYFIGHFFEGRIVSKTFDRIKSDLNLTKAESDIIRNAIKHHPLSFPYKKLNKKRDYYTRILQDADTIEYFRKERRTQIIPKKKTKKSRFTHYLIDKYLNNSYTKIYKYLNFPEIGLVFNSKTPKPSYKEFGDPKLPTLVFLPGYAGDHRVYLPLAEKLKTNYHIILVDLPTTLTNTPQNLYTLSNYFINLVNYLKLDKFTLTGFSLNGILATHLASIYQNQLDKLILLCSFPKLNPPIPRKFISNIIKEVGQKNADIYYKFIRTNKAARNLFGFPKTKYTVSHVQKHYHAIFPAMIHLSSLDLIETYKKLKIDKDIILVKDDSVLNLKKIQKLAKKHYLKTTMLESGGHNQTPEFMGNLATYFLK